MIDRDAGKGFQTWRLGAGIALALAPPVRRAAQTPAPATGAAAAPAARLRRARAPGRGQLLRVADLADLQRRGDRRGRRSCDQRHRAPVAKADAPAGDIARFGDTKTQAAGVLKAIETQLAGQGLSMADVVYLRAYLVADPAKGAIDVDGWNAAYRRCSARPPTRPSRPARPLASRRSSTRSG
jgi:hypothetical protein